MNYNCFTSKVLFLYILIAVIIIFSYYKNILYGAGEIAHSNNCLNCKANDFNLIRRTWIKQARYGRAQLQSQCHGDKQEISWGCWPERIADMTSFRRLRDPVKKVDSV